MVVPVISAQHMEGILLQGRSRMQEKTASDWEHVCSNLDFFKAVFRKLFLLVKEYSALHFPLTFKGKYFIYCFYVVFDLIFHELQQSAFEETWTPHARCQRRNGFTTFYYYIFACSLKFQHQFKGTKCHLRLRESTKAERCYNDSSNTLKI